MQLMWNNGVFTYLQDVLIYATNMYGSSEYRCVVMNYRERDQFHMRYDFFKPTLETIVMHLIFAACVPVDRYNELNRISNENKNKV